MIAKKHRLRNRADFHLARNSGKVYRHPIVTLVARPNETSVTRIGIVAGRSTGGAVLRNLIKRRLRACMNEQLSFIHKGWDIIIIARQKSGLVSFDELCHAVVCLLKKAGVIQPAERQI